MRIIYKSYPVNVGGIVSTPHGYRIVAQCFPLPPEWDWPATYSSPMWQVTIRDPQTDDEKRLCRGQPNPA